jgi:hypothetical protein
MYQKEVLFTNHRMEVNLEIYLDGVHPKENPHKGPPFNPHFGSCGWLEPNPCIYYTTMVSMPTTQPIPKPSTKLYKKL